VSGIAPALAAPPAKHNASAAAARMEGKFEDLNFEGLNFEGLNFEGLNFEGLDFEGHVAVLMSLLPPQ
jgi:uncharacterized protein YjbI with pentapeptide repeats